MVERHSSETGSSSSMGYAGDISPRETWERLARETAAQLIDVRTVAEWNFVGVPDLTSLERQALLCEWQHFPPAPNSGFVQEVAEALKQSGYRPGAPLICLCPSGARAPAAGGSPPRAGDGPRFRHQGGFA